MQVPPDLRAGKKAPKTRLRKSPLTARCQTNKLKQSFKKYARSVVKNTKSPRSGRCESPLPSQTTYMRRYNWLLGNSSHLHLRHSCLAGLKASKFGCIRQPKSKYGKQQVRWSMP